VHFKDVLAIFFFLSLFTSFLNFEILKNSLQTVGNKKKLKIKFPEQKGARINGQVLKELKILL
jgi:hypothetical protein